jgi:hypothetical protein
VLPGPNNGRHWIKPLTGPFAPAPDWIPEDSTKERPPGEPKPFKGNTPYGLGALKSACSNIENARPVLYPCLADRPPSPRLPPPPRPSELSEATPVFQSAKVPRASHTLVTFAARIACSLKKLPAIVSVAERRTGRHLAPRMLFDWGPSRRGRTRQGVRDLGPDRGSAQDDRPQQEQAVEGPGKARETIGREGDGKAA